MLPKSNQNILKKAGIVAGSLSLLALGVLGGVGMIGGESLAAGAAVEESLTAGGSAGAAEESLTADIARKNKAQTQIAKRFRGNKGRKAVNALKKQAGEASQELSALKKGWSAEGGGGGGGAATSLSKTGGSLRKGYFLHKETGRKISLHVVTFGYEDYLKADLERKGYLQYFQRIESPGQYQIRMGDRMVPLGDGTGNLGSKNPMVERILTHLKQGDGTDAVPILVDDSSHNIEEFKRRWKKPYGYPLQIHGGQGMQVGRFVGDQEDDANYLLQRTIPTALGKSNPDQSIALLFDADETMYRGHVSADINDWVYRAPEHQRLSKAQGVQRALDHPTPEYELSKGFVKFMNGLMEMATFHEM
jgi:hypothetical protein